MRPAIRVLYRARADAFTYSFHPSADSARQPPGVSQHHPNPQRHVSRSSRAPNSSSGGVHDVLQRDRAGAGRNYGRAARCDGVFVCLFVCSTHGANEPIAIFRRCGCNGCVRLDFSACVSNLNPRWSFQRDIAGRRVRTLRIFVINRTFLDGGDLISSHVYGCYPHVQQNKIRPSVRSRIQGHRTTSVEAGHVDSRPATFGPASVVVTY